MIFHFSFAVFDRQPAGRQVNNSWVYLGLAAFFPFLLVVLAFLASQLSSQGPRQG
jgi:hypothetical protein